VQHERASPKIIFFAQCPHERFVGLSFSVKTLWWEQVIWKRYRHGSSLDWRKEPEDFVTQQDGAPPHFRPDVRHWLNDILPHQWIGRGANEDLMFCPWPKRSPNLTPCDYFLRGYVKDKVFVPPQPVSIPDLKTRITAAVETFTPDLLIRVWQELDYRLNVCRVTKGAHIEHL